MIALLQQGTPAAQLLTQLGMGGMCLLVVLQCLHGMLQGLQLLLGASGLGLCQLCCMLVQIGL